MAIDDLPDCVEQISEWAILERELPDVLDVERQVLVGSAPLLEVIRGELVILDCEDDVRLQSKQALTIPVEHRRVDDHRLALQRFIQPHAVGELRFRNI